MVWDSALLQAPEPESPSENAMETPKKASKPVISGDLDLDTGLIFWQAVVSPGSSEQAPKKAIPAVCADKHRMPFLLVTHVQPIPEVSAEPLNARLKKSRMWR